MLSICVAALQWRSHEHAPCGVCLYPQALIWCFHAGAGVQAQVCIEEPASTHGQGTNSPAGRCGLCQPGRLCAAAQVVFLHPSVTCLGHPARPLTWTMVCIRHALPPVWLDCLADLHCNAWAALIRECAAHGAECCFMEPARHPVSSESDADMMDSTSVHCKTTKAHSDLRTPMHRVEDLEAEASGWSAQVVEAQAAAQARSLTSGLPVDHAWLMQSSGWC